MVSSSRSRARTFRAAASATNSPCHTNTPSRHTLLRMPPSGMRFSEARLALPPTTFLPPALRPADSPALAFPRARTLVSPPRSSPRRTHVHRPPTLLPSRLSARRQHMPQPDLMTVLLPTARCKQNIHVNEVMDRWNTGTMIMSDWLVYALYLLIFK